MTHTPSQECCDRENYLLMQKQFLCADMRYIFLRESKSAVYILHCCQLVKIAQALLNINLTATLLCIKYNAE